MRTVENAAGAALAALFCAASLWTGVSHAQATPDAAAKEVARNLAVGVCGSCHGAEGRSTNVLVPNLAAQQRAYIEVQLKAYRSQSRGGPDAHDYMWGIASTLDDGVIAGLASYYSSQSPVPGTPADAATLATARQLYDKGDPTRGVLACTTCHGANAQGMSVFPRLAGQHSQYLVRQMQLFRVRLRDSPVMHGVIKDLTDTDMSALAGYLQSK